MLWVRRFLEPSPEFVLSLHLHAINNKAAAKQHWREALELPEARFTKTYLKPAGTGHRKNTLPHGVCRVRVCRSTDAFVTVMVWIDSLEPLLATAVSSAVTLSPGR